MRALLCGTGQCWGRAEAGPSPGAGTHRGRQGDHPCPRTADAAEMPEARGAGVTCHSTCFRRNPPLSLALQTAMALRRSG